MEQEPDSGKTHTPGHDIANAVIDNTTAPDDDSLGDLIAQLRDANQHLVLAAVEAQTSRDEAEAVNRRQTEFLAMLAHELRNPLAPISMAATLLEKVASSHPELPRLQSIIQRQVGQMARLLDDLLDAARISSGRIVLKRTRIRIGDLLAQAVESAQPSMDLRRQTLRLEVPATPLLVDGDPVRLAQVFSNLVLNASKFTAHNGNIVLSAALDSDSITVTVQDSGVGIPPEVLPRIFDLFVQGPQSLDRAEGGLGIGLCIVRGLVRMHGGTVAAFSEGFDRGSKFTVRLPIASLPQIEEGSPPDAARRSGSCRILIIEDNIDAHETLKEFLKLEGHDVSSAFDGTAGLAMARENAYEIIICDIGLPGADGFEVISSFRSGWLGELRPWAVALSGYGAKEDQQRAAAAGFDHYLVKPVSPAALSALIASRMAHQPRTPEVS